MNKEKNFGIELEKTENTATLAFSFPPHNSLSKNTLSELAEKIDEVSSDEKIRILIVKSGGNRTFCAGADFNELIAVTDYEESVDFFNGFAGLFFSMVSCSKPILSRIQGKAVGGALGIIAASDLSYASVHGEIKLSELNVGIGPFVVGPIIQHKIGVGNLSKLTFSPNLFFPAMWAERVGLYAEVFETIEDLDGKIKTKARELLTYNPEALAQIKRVMRPDPEKLKNLLDERKKISANLLLTPFAQNRLKALTNKS